MNNRLQQFLELENLTPARLADMLGIQRSGLSHILSGRNKPSCEFLTRILTKFPHINADWLMTGRGKAYRDSSESVIIPTPLPPSSANQNSPYRSGLNGANFHGTGTGTGIHGQVFQGEQIGNSINGQYLQSSQFNNPHFGCMKNEDSPILDNFNDSFPEVELEGSTANNTYNTENEDVNPNQSTPQPAENCVNAANKASAGQKKRVKRVIVFYSDGSFEELFPHIR